MRPLDRRPQGLLARIRIAATLEQIEPVGDALQDLLGRESFVRAAASSSASGMLSNRPQSSRTTALEGSCDRAQNSSTASGSASGSTSYSTSPRTRSSSREVTSIAEVRTRLGQRGELRCCLDHLLEVVEQQEQLSFADVLRQLALRTKRLR